MKNLVIVESPAKAKTIEKFLGADYKVMSSYGHIRDLKKKGISIDFNENFTPQYEVPDDKKNIVRELKKAAKEADTVWLASDEDREGEAIAWHLSEVLGLNPETTRRIVFHEITKPAILNAIAHPRHIDLDRVNAQQARRVLDRIVGFELSPVLWKKIKPALSAGRVQSVAVRLICEREKEIGEFIPEAYFRVKGDFKTAGGALIKGELNQRLSSREEALSFLEKCNGATFEVQSVETRPLKRSPLPPFTTSTLQQEAGRRLGFTVNQTMRIAQKLYENGQITYMRTDSMNLSELALNDIARNIAALFGEGYSQRRHYHTSSKGAQEAHEAIRPTYVSNRTISGTAQEQKLYDLIWRRAVASQMSDALLDKTSVEIDIHPAGNDNAVAVTDKKAHFKAEGSTVRHPGFMKVYSPEAEKESILPAVEAGEKVTADTIDATQRFTTPPPRYTEASLVKKMEELGIGRPSTYAPTISTIQARDYVARGEKEGAPREFESLELKGEKITEKQLTENTASEKGKLVPTDVGMIVNDFLTDNFPNILDYNFTANIEEKFDDIAEGKLGWQDEMADFYGGFHPEIEKINALRSEHKVGERKLGTDPNSGKNVYVKVGRFGPVVQIGEATDEEKPLFSSLGKDQSINTITLEEALKLFELPRTVGEFEGKKVVAAVGRFGPYLRHDSKFVSIPKDKNPRTITIEEAEELILAKREAEAKKFIREFEGIPGLQALNGRWGPYLAYKPEGQKKATNIKIPKGTDPMAITIEEARKLIESAKK